MRSSLLDHGLGVVQFVVVFVLYLRYHLMRLRYHQLARRAMISESTRRPSSAERQFGGSESGETQPSPSAVDFVRLSLERDRRRRPYHTPSRSLAPPYGQTSLPEKGSSEMHKKKEEDLVAVTEFVKHCSADGPGHPFT